MSNVLCNIRLCLFGWYDSPLSCRAWLFLWAFSEKTEQEIISMGYDEVLGFCRLLVIIWWFKIRLICAFPFIRNAFWCLIPLVLIHLPIYTSFYKNCVSLTLILSLASSKRGNDFQGIIFGHVLRVKFMNTSCDMTLGWIKQNPFDDKSTLAQKMPWCCQITNHYIS